MCTCSGTDLATVPSSMQGVVCGGGSGLPSLEINTHRKVQAMHTALNDIRARTAVIEANLGMVWVVGRCIYASVLYRP